MKKKTRKMKKKEEKRKKKSEKSSFEIRKNEEAEGNQKTKEKGEFETER